jgi:hypothetical protein
MSASEPFIKHVEDLAQRGPFGNGCVDVGVSFDGYHMPQQEVERLFHRVVKAGVKLITSHSGNFGKPKRPII